MLPFGSRVLQRGLSNKKSMPKGQCNGGSGFLNMALPKPSGVLKLPIRVESVQKAFRQWDRLFPLQLLVAAAFVLVMFATKPEEGEMRSRGLLFVAMGGLGAVSWFYFPVLPLYCAVMAAPIYDSVGIKLLLTVLALATGLRAYFRSPGRGVFSWPGIVFCAWAGASLLWVQKINLGLDGFLLGVVPNMLLAVAVAIHGGRSANLRRNLLFAVAAGAAVSCVYILNSFQQGIMFMGNEVKTGAGRYEAMIRTDTFSSWTMICAVFALALAFTHQRRRLPYMVSMPLFGFFFVATALTGTRGSVLGVLFALVVFTISSDRSKVGTLLTAAVAGICLVAIVYLYPSMFGDLFERFTTIREDEGSGRLEIFQQALQIFAQHPVMGVGWDGFLALTRTLTHNVYLQVLADLGLVGFAVFCWWMGTLFVSSRRSSDRVTLWVLLATLLFQGLVYHQFFYTECHRCHQIVSHCKREQGGI